MEAPFYNGAMPNLLDIFDKFIHADWFQEAFFFKQNFLITV